MVYGICIGMTLTIDKAGRVVLPKPLRDRMGLREGSSLEVVETGDGVILKPVESESYYVKEGNIMVYTGKLPPGYDILRAVEEDREERIRFLAGL
jgi:AbrB family looped-hinge helix DNA binding protein